MNLLCNIIVAISINETQVSVQNLDVHGILIKEDSLYYTVNFSKEAKEKNFYGDYSARITSKEDCTIIK